MSAPLFCHVKEGIRHVLRHWLMVNEYVGYWWSVFEVADEPPPPLDPVIGALRLLSV